MWAYDKRTITLSHAENQPITFKIELDLTGAGLWVTYGHYDVARAQSATVEFEPTVHARWLRVSANEACTATAQLEYR